MHFLSLPRVGVLQNVACPYVLLLLWCEILYEPNQTSYQDQGGRAEKPRTIFCSTDRSTCDKVLSLIADPTDQEFTDGSYHNRPGYQRTNKVFDENSIARPAFLEMTTRFLGLNQCRWGSAQNWTSIGSVGNRGSQARHATRHLEKGVSHIRD
jgi:hypothetical protein